MYKLKRFLNGMLLISLFFSRLLIAQSPEQICASASDIQNRCASSPADTIAAVIPTSRNPSQTLYNIVTAWRTQGGLGQVIADEILRILSAQVSVVGAQQALTKGKDKRKNELDLVNLCVKQVSSLCAKLPVLKPVPVSTPCSSNDCIAQIRDTLKASYSESSYATFSVDPESITFPSTPQKAYLKLTAVQTLSEEGEPTAEIAKMDKAHFIIHCIALKKAGCDLVTASNLKLYSSKYSGINIAGLTNAKVQIRDIDSASNWGIDSDNVEEKFKNGLPTKYISVIAPLAAVFNMSRMSSKDSSLGIGKELARTISDSLSLNLEVSGAEMGSNTKAAPANAPNAAASGCNTITGTGCPEGLVCNYAGQCRQADCTYSYIWGDSCPNGLHCFLGTCRACSADSHCGSGKICASGTCKPGNCNYDSDCGQKQKCEENTCVDSECNPLNDSCPSGYVCDFDGKCKKGVCSSDIDCGCNQHCGDTPSGKACLSGGCYVGIWPACFYGCHSGQICDSSGASPTCKSGCEFDEQCGHCKNCKNRQCVENPRGCPPGCDRPGGNSGCGPGKECCGTEEGGVCKPSCDTPEVPPSPSPENSPSPDISPSPTSEPEDTVVPTPEPTAPGEPTTEPEQTPLATAVPEETAAPTPEPTAAVEPTVEPEESPVATAVPEETEVPQDTPTPQNCFDSDLPVACCISICQERCTTDQCRANCPAACGAECIRLCEKNLKPEDPSVDCEKRCNGKCHSAENSNGSREQLKECYEIE